MLAQEEQFLTVDEVARLLKYHPEHVRRLARQGRLNARKFGGKEWRFRLSDIERVFEQEPEADDET